MRNTRSGSFRERSEKRGSRTRSILVTVLGVIVLIILGLIGLAVAVDFGLIAPNPTEVHVTLPDSQFPR